MINPSDTSESTMSALNKDCLGQMYIYIYIYIYIYMEDIYIYVEDIMAWYHISIAAGTDRLLLIHVFFVCVCSTKDWHMVALYWTMAALFTRWQIMYGYKTHYNYEIGLI